MADPEAATGLIETDGVLTVIPGVAQARFAVPAGDSAPPVFCRGSVIRTVSPGSSRPSLSPDESEITRLSKANSGELIVRVKLLFQVSRPEDMATVKLATVPLAMVSAIMMEKAPGTVDDAPAAKEAIVSAASVTVIPVVAQDRTAVTLLAEPEPTFWNVTSK